MVAMFDDVGSLVPVRMGNLYWFCLQRQAVRSSSRSKDPATVRTPVKVMSTVDIRESSWINGREPPVVSIGVRRDERLRFHCPRPYWRGSRRNADRRVVLPGVESCLRHCEVKDISVTDTTNIRGPESGCRTDPVGHVLRGEKRSDIRPVLPVPCLGNMP